MEFKWKVLGVVSIGSLMGAIDATVLLIAFPQIAIDLHATLVQMVWVLMVYILMGTALVLSLGRIADMKGRKRLYNAGFAVFVVGSALCGFAADGWQLIAFRALQGVGGAMLIANSFAILSDAFPPTERGRAFGINTIVWGAGSIFGIVLGGLILTVASWRWIFWINVPIGIAATVLAALVLRESVTPNPRETFDLPAAFLFTAGLGSLLLAATDALLTSPTAPATWIPLLVGVPLLGGFVLWEARVSRDPILPFSLFANRLFDAALSSSVLQGVAIFATNFLLMAYFQLVRHVSVLSAAYLLVPLSVALAVVGPLAGRLSDRYGARVLATAGLLVQGTVLVLLAGINSSTSLATVAAYEALLGVGGGLFFPANTSSIMSGVERRRYGVAAGVMMTLRNSAMSMSYVVGLLAVTSRLPAGTSAAIFGGGITAAGFNAYRGVFLDGMHVAFLLAAGFVFVAAVLSALRGREVRFDVESYVVRSAVRSPGRAGSSTAPGARDRY
jgi:EmrB/QacA subfamily drug resistance transporter